MRLKFSVIAILLVVVAALSRILPHPPNVTPVAAMGLFGAAYFSSKRMTYLIPFMALFLSDLFINNFLLRSFFPEATGIIWFTEISLFVYIGFALTIFLSRYVLKRVNTINVVKASLLASVIFYLVSNFGVWLTMTNTALSLVTLIEVYVAGLPYFLNSLLGNIFFAAVFFGAAEYIRRNDFKFVIQDTPL